jgi:coenzyme F420-reducing hydrogenase delta subunit
MRGNKNDEERCNFIAEKVIELVIENRKLRYSEYDASQ